MNEAVLQAVIKMTKKNSVHYRFNVPIMDAVFISTYFLGSVNFLEYQSEQVYVHYWVMEEVRLA